MPTPRLRVGTVVLVRLAHMTTASSANASDGLARDFRESAGPSVPAYQRVKLLIGGRVRSGAWTEGMQIPSENQLVDALGLSRMTINRAYRELSAEGLIVRIPGVGTFVADVRRPSPLLEVRSIGDEIAERGGRHRMSMRYVRCEDAGAHRGLLDDADFTAPTVFHSLAVHFEDDIPIQIEDRYVNPVTAPGYLDQDFTEITPHAYLSAVAPLTRGEHVVEAVMPTADEAAMLAMEASEPCLLVRRRTWSGDRIVTAARLLYPGSRSRLEGSFTTT